MSLVGGGKPAKIFAPIVQGALQIGYKTQPGHNKKRAIADNKRASQG